MHTGKVCVSPYLPFGGDCGIIKASGLTTRKKDRLWLPVSVYYIEHPKGKILVDAGWSRSMSPNGVYDKKAQCSSLGSPFLYQINQGVVKNGETAPEKLRLLGVEPKDLDFVLLTHLDCDHANGLDGVKEAKRILVSKAELDCSKRKSFQIKLRYQSRWWSKTPLESFDWNDDEGPFQKTFDLFGDGSVKMINIPGHSDGLCAVKIKNNDGKFVLLFSDGGYSSRSWKEQVTSGICIDKEKQKRSLEWIRKESLDENCVESLANHDSSVQEHMIEL